MLKNFNDFSLCNGKSSKLFVKKHSDCTNQFLKMTLKRYLNCWYTTSISFWRPGLPIFSRNSHWQQILLLYLLNYFIFLWSKIYSKHLVTVTLLLTQYLPDKIKSSDSYLDILQEEDVNSNLKTKLYDNKSDDFHWSIVNPPFLYSNTPYHHLLMGFISFSLFVMQEDALHFTIGCRFCGIKPYIFLKTATCW